MTPSGSRVIPWLFAKVEPDLIVRLVTVMDGSVALSDIETKKPKAKAKAKSKASAPSTASAVEAC